MHVFERNDTLSFLTCGIALWVGGHVSDPIRMVYSSPAALAELGAQMPMQHDVLLALGQMVTEFRLNESGAGVTVVTTAGEYDVDYAFMGAGFLPRTDLFEGQLETLPNGAIKTDEYMRAFPAGSTEASSDILAGSTEASSDILAAGDSCTVLYNPTGTYDYIPLATNAVRQALLVAANIEEPMQKYMGTQATSAVQLYDLSLAASGLTQAILAAGDSCTVLYNPTGTYDYIPLATNAVRQALLVAANIEEPMQKYMGTQATSAVQLYDLSLAASGLTQAGAEARGVNARSTTIVQDYRPDFMLTTTPVTATLTWDPETRRVLGAQFLCRHDVAEAANAISIAIQARFTIDQLANVDLFFQPNFCQPVNFIGAVAMQAVAEQDAC